MLQCVRVLGACAKFIFGQEVGESGTPHLQGCVHFEAKQRFTAVKKMLSKKVRWSKMIKTWPVNVRYCTKEAKGDWGKLHGNIPEASRFAPGEKACMEGQFANVSWRPWQQNVIDICNAEPDARKIYWFWEPDGGCGKSFLAKWLAINYRCVVGTGKRGDIFHQVTKMMDANAEHWPRLVLFDIPRCSKDFVSWSAIEALKNGCVISTKYEGGEWYFPPPQVICFANEEPQYEKMSADRWVGTVRRVRKQRSVGEALRRVGAGGVSANLIV